MLRSATPKYPLIVDARPQASIYCGICQDLSSEARFTGGQEADIAVLAINSDFKVYGNPFFSVQFTQLHVGAVNLCNQTNETSPLDEKPSLVLARFLFRRSREAMDMNKNGLVAAVATISGANKANAAKAVDAMCNAITDASAGARMSAW